MILCISSHVDTFPKTAISSHRVKKVLDHKPWFICVFHQPQRRQQRQIRTKQQRSKLSHKFKRRLNVPTFLLTSSVHLFKLFLLLHDGASFFHLTMMLKPGRQNVLIQRTSSSRYECGIASFSAIFTS